MAEEDHRLVGFNLMLDNEALMKPSKVEFYDLSKDPWQINDLAEFVLSL